jgi:alpha-beta hydrolase superfamily lysophospholipase
MFAVGRSTAFAAAVDQAGGALVWDGSEQMRRALIAAAERVTTPTLLLVAQNDRTTASGMASAPGHRIFAAEGAGIWERSGREVRALGVAT